MRKPPKEKRAGDRAHDVGRAAISVIPYAGGALQIMFENVFSSPIERRKQAWLEELADVVTELQDKVDGLTPEKLASNDQFITASLQASQIALRTHKEEKLHALRNAVLNSALSHAPEDDEQSIFIRLIDQLTPSHLRILDLLSDPVKWMVRNNVKNPGWSMGGVATVIEHCLPNLNGKRDLYDQIVRDLQAEGLIGQGNFLHVTMTGHGMVDSRITNRGSRFLEFISEPS